MVGIASIDYAVGHIFWAWISDTTTGVMDVCGNVSPPGCTNAFGPPLITCLRQSCWPRWFHLPERRNGNAATSAFKSQIRFLKPSGSIRARRPTDRRRLSIAGSAVLGKLAGQSISNEIVRLWVGAYD